MEHRPAGAAAPSRRRRAGGRPPPPETGPWSGSPARRGRRVARPARPPRGRWRATGGGAGGCRGVWAANLTTGTVRAAPRTRARRRRCRSARPPAWAGTGATTGGTVPDDRPATGSPAPTAVAGPPRLPRGGHRRQPGFVGQPLDGRVIRCADGEHGGAGQDAVAVATEDRSGDALREAEVVGVDDQQLGHRSSASASSSGFDPPDVASHGAAAR